MTFSNDGDVAGLHGSYFSDCWILKIDNTGLIEWQKTLGGTFGDAAYSIVQTSDSGYVVSASTSSNDGDITNFHGTSDCWVFKLNKSGKLLWQKALGGTNSDANIGSGIMPLSDSVFLVVTITSSIDGDVSGRKGDSSADGDIWFVKLSPEQTGVGSKNKKTDISFYPNPSLGKGKINYDLDRHSLVRIEVLDILGRHLRTLCDKMEEAGIHKHDFDISDLPSGRYFLRIDLDGKSVINALELTK